MDKMTRIFEEMTSGLDLAPKKGDSITVWFSCGAASAVAAYLTIEKYGSMCDIRIVNNWVAEEHEDNRRFAQDVGTWLGADL